MLKLPLIIFDELIVARILTSFSSLEKNLMRNDWYWTV